MAVTEDNMYTGDNANADDINLPVVNLEVQRRETSTAIEARNLSQPADIFIDTKSSEC